MEKSEMIDFLKDNLSIDVEEKRSSGFNNDTYQVIKLVLQGEVISEDYLNL